MYNKPANTLHSKFAHPKDKTPLENQLGTIYHITCDNNPIHTYIGESKRPLGVPFREHLNLDEVPGREQVWHRCRVEKQCSA